MIAIPIAVNWQELVAIATILAGVAAPPGVLVALIIGIRTTRAMIRQEQVTREAMIRQEQVTRDGYRLQAEQARAAASRGEAATRLTEEYTRRVVEALEAMASRANMDAAAGQATVERVLRVRWHISKEGDEQGVPYGGSWFTLENDGESIARNVRIFSHPSLKLFDFDKQDIFPNETVRFGAIPSWVTQDLTITVVWTDDLDGETRTWKYPLPIED